MKTNKEPEVIVFDHLSSLTGGVDKNTNVTKIIQKLKELSNGNPVVYKVDDDIYRTTWEGKKAPLYTVDKIDIDPLGLLDVVPRFITITFNTKSIFTEDNDNLLLIKAGINDIHKLNKCSRLMIQCGNVFRFIKMRGEWTDVLNNSKVSFEKVSPEYMFNVDPAELTHRDIIVVVESNGDKLLHDAVMQYCMMDKIITNGLCNLSNRATTIPYSTGIKIRTMKSRKDIPNKYKFIGELDNE